MYHPQEDLLTGIRQLFPFQLLPGDHYARRMGHDDVILERDNILAAKSFFIRRGPWKGPLAWLFGLTEALRTLQDLHLDDPDFIRAIEDIGLGTSEFLDWLQKERKIRVRLYAPPEGSIFIPGEPVITAEGPLAHIRLVEGAVTEGINYPSLVGTRAWRCVQAAGGGKVLEFGKRRSSYGLRSSLYAYLAGFASSSNDEVRQAFNIPTGGTMGHEWVQSFSSQVEAFRAWMQASLKNPCSAMVLLVDTIDTLGSGVPEVIRVFEEFLPQLKNDKRPVGIRIDSGDLAYLTMASAKMLFQAGFTTAPIVLSSDLDEFEIERIRKEIEERAKSEFGLDPDHVLRLLIWGIGTRYATCTDHSSLGMVGKLMAIQLVSGERDEVIKLSNTLEKVSIPGNNRSAWVVNKKNELVTVLVYPSSYSVHDGKLFDNKGQSMTGCKIYDPSRPGKFMTLEKNYCLQPRQQLVFDSISRDGIIDNYRSTLTSVRKHVREETDRLHWTQRKIRSAWPIKLSLVPELYFLRQKMQEEQVLHASQLA